MTRLIGRTATVTGASRGIAQRLTLEGAAVLFVARTETEHDRLAGQRPVRRAA